MYIKQLTLKNYRNYDELDVVFDDKVNVIIGENAQGKTNLMEAIYVLALTKSHRTSKERELIKWDKESAKISGNIYKRKQSFPLDIYFSSKGKKAKLNHLEQKRLSDYIGAMNVVMFAPEDLSIVKGSPQHRRRFINMELGQIKPSYMYDLIQYQKILKQRNHLLKQMKYKPQMDQTILDVLTDQLIEYGAKVLEQRLDFVDILEDMAARTHSQISRGLENLEIRYNASIDVSIKLDRAKIVEIYSKKFQETRDKEIERRTTLIGPHRDDLVFFVNERNVQTYGSQGQQRTTALSLKLAELELIYQEVGEYPILLLDDVLSELDDYRQSHLLDTIQGKIQTFVSTTTIDGIHHDTLKEAEIFHIRQGRIET